MIWDNEWDERPDREDTEKERCRTACEGCKQYRDASCYGDCEDFHPDAYDAVTAEYLEAVVAVDGEDYPGQTGDILEIREAFGIDNTRIKARLEEIERKWGKLK